MVTLTAVIMADIAFSWLFVSTFDKELFMLDHELMTVILHGAAREVPLYDYHYND